MMLAEELALDQVGKRCTKCGRRDREHLIGGVCPKALTITLDAAALERVNRTGHPRVLRMVLDNEHRGVFQDIKITRVTT